MQPLSVYSDAQINASKITSLEKLLYLTFWVFFTVNTDLKITSFQRLRELDIVFLYSQ